MSALAAIVLTVAYSLTPIGIYYLFTKFLRGCPGEPLVIIPILLYGALTLAIACQIEKSFTKEEQCQETTSAKL